MRSPPRSARHVYTLLVTLSDVEPAVWRRLRVSSGASLSRVVRIVAVAMEWPAGRPYAFVKGSLRYDGQGPPSPARTGHAAEPRLRQLLHDPGATLELDYGSSRPWHLVLRLERVLPPNDQLLTPWCEDGAGRAPPIDVGGPWAYEEWRTEGADGSDAAADDVGEPPWPTAAPSRPEDERAAPAFLGFNAAHVNAQLERLRR